jgi:hypothetical protein
MVTEFQHLRAALGGRKAELHEEEGQIDSEVSRGGYAAGRRGAEKTLLGSCELFRSQGLQTFHGLIVSGDICGSFPECR